jgi:hypothetical protein
VSSSLSNQPPGPLRNGHGNHHHHLHASPPPSVVGIKDTPASLVHFIPSCAPAIHKMISSTKRWGILMWSYNIYSCIWQRVVFASSHHLLTWLTYDVPLNYETISGRGTYHSGSRQAWSLMCLPVSIGHSFMHPCIMPWKHNARCKSARSYR